MDKLIFFYPTISTDYMEIRGVKRPELSSLVENIEEYDIIFIGYPVWLAYHNLIQCTQA